ncbi:glycosyltransferase [Hahella aquimaris]|uniref:glycosyltransferase n=1 Tax=Hahella sp. HNIBRBA332 TaxID=3015983 RepID=UPI00273AED5D|nr:glycosyltransferase [Hahella sp. HNIBRBA332]WLQ17056.1 glycosyltransferase [Hahella sp. HNIBRBA332]
MSKLVFCWELGGELGHLATLSELAREFVSHNHQVTVILKDLSKVPFFFTDIPVTVLQAPLWPVKGKSAKPSSCIADILLKRGYESVEGLATLVSAWQTLFRLIQADALFFDFAPTAMLASRSLSIPKFTVGAGFSELSPGQPNPNIRPETADYSQVYEAESKVVANMNPLVQAMGLSPLSFLSDLFQADGAFIASYSELDFQAAHRQHALYCGPVAGDFRGEVAAWPQETGKKVIAYLKPFYQHLENVLDGIQGLGETALVICPGIAADLISQYQSDVLRIYPYPVALDQALSEADLSICHGGMGMLAKSVKAGVPIACLPTQQEQFLNSRTASESGVGEIVDGENVDALIGSLQRLLASEALQSRARESASKYAEQQRGAELIRQRVEALLAQRGRKS